MAVKRCIVVARASEEESVDLIRARLTRLIAFYAPLGDARLSERYLQAAGVVIGLIDFGGNSPDLSSPAVFGAELPAGLRSTEALLEAKSDVLRLVEGPLAVAAFTPDRVRVITACGPPTMLYEAGSSSAQVWSSHAVAAAYVARGTVGLDADSMPEFLAAQFVGGNRTLIRDVTAVESATLISISRAGVKTRSFWPARERWELLDPADAYHHAERALLTALPRRLEPYGRPFCGLTGGLDSRVVAVTLGKLGIDCESFTFGEADWPDVQQAAEIAETLGIRHQHARFEWLDDEVALRTTRAEVRWHEGAIQLGFGRVAWPGGIQAWITGGGGETGRAFYYQGHAAHDRHGDEERVTDVLSAALQGRIAGAREEALAGVRRSVESWIAEARSLGCEGWRVLDIVYAEQRVRRWARGMLTHAAGVPIPALASPEVQRGLVSLPLDDRISDGFHRRFLERHAPRLLPAELKRGSVPRSILRRGGARMRRSLVCTAARARPRRSAEPPLGHRWTRHPLFHAWIADEILRSPTLQSALGKPWCEEIRRTFLEGNGDAEATALWAAGPVALAQELETLG